MPDLVSDPSLIVAGACKLIAAFEGLRLTAYPDPDSPLAKRCRQLGQPMFRPWTQALVDASELSGAPWTIGYGSTSHADGTPIAPNETWTRDQCAADLSRRVTLLLNQVGALVQVPLPDEAYGALMSLAYNCGIGAEERSLKNGGLLERLNAGDYAGAANLFGRYVHANGQIDPGLVTRRKAEQLAFLASCRAAGLIASEGAHV